MKNFVNFALSGKLEKRISIAIRRKGWTTISIR